MFQFIRQLPRFTPRIISTSTTARALAHTAHPPFLLLLFSLPPSLVFTPIIGNASFLPHRQQMAYASKKKGLDITIASDQISISQDQLQKILNESKTSSKISNSTEASYKERQKMKAQIRKGMLERNKKHAEQLQQQKEKRAKPPKTPSPGKQDEIDRDDDMDDTQGLEEDVLDLFKPAPSDNLPAPKKRKMAKFLADEPPDDPTPKQ